MKVTVYFTCIYAITLCKVRHNSFRLFKLSHLTERVLNLALCNDMLHRLNQDRRSMIEAFPKHIEAKASITISSPDLDHLITVLGILHTGTSRLRLLEVVLIGPGSVPFPELHIWSRTQPVLASGGASRPARSRFPTATTSRLPSGKMTAPSLTLRHTSSKSRSSARLLKAHNSSCTSLAVVVSHPPSLKKGNKRCDPQC